MRVLGARGPIPWTAFALMVGSLGLAAPARVISLPPWTGHRQVTALAVKVFVAGDMLLLFPVAAALLATVLGGLALATRHWRQCGRAGALRTWTPVAWGAALGLLVPWVDPWTHHSTAWLLPVTGIAMGAGVSVRRWMCLSPADRSPPRWLAPALIAAAAFLLPALLASPWTPTWHKLLGDEPHYLLMAHSILVDGDFELADNYLDEDYFHFFPNHGLPPHTRPGLEEGSRYSFHGYGLAFWLVPWYALATGLDVEAFTALVRAAMALWSLLFALVLWALLRDVAGRRAAAWGTLFAVLCGPVLFNAPSLFPDAVAMTLSCFAYWLLRRRPGPGGALLAGLSLGFLPWLHYKFTGMMAAVAALGLAWLLVPSLAPGPRSESDAPGPSGRARTAAALLAAGVAAGLGAHMVYTWTVFGRLSPMAVVVGAGSVERQIMHGDDLLAYLGDPWGMLRTAVGYFLDQKDGWLFYAPHTLMAAAGGAWLARRRARELVALLFVLASYLGPVAASQAFGYWGPVGRWILGASWVLAVLAGVGLVRPGGSGGPGRVLAWLRGGLLGLTVALTTVLVGTSALVFNDLGVSYSLLLQHHGGPGLEPWRAFPLVLLAAGSRPQELVTIAWCVVAVVAVAAVIALALRAEAGGRGGRKGPGRDATDGGRMPVEPRGALAVGAAVALLLLAHHARVPQSAPALHEARDYGQVRVSIPRRPPERAWLHEGATWFGGADTVRATLSTPRPIETLEVRVMALVGMDGEVQVGDALSRLRDLRPRSVRRIVLRPGPGTRWRGRWYYPLRVRSGDTAPAAMLGDPQDVRMFGLNVVWGDVSVRAPRRD